MAAALAAPSASVTAAGTERPGGLRDRFWRWWLASVFQQTWMRLAVQTGVCTLLIMVIFSPPPVWELHTFDPILANPVLVLVLANLQLLFTVRRTPAHKSIEPAGTCSILGGRSSTLAPLPRGPPLDARHCWLDFAGQHWPPSF